MADDYSDIPEMMRQARRWLLWKPDKQPFYADGTPRRGQLDGPDDLSRLSTFNGVVEKLERSSGEFAGIGFALGPDGTGFYWQGIDLDAVSDHPGLDLIRDELPGYTELSPSGTGHHAIGYGRYFKTFNKSKSHGIEAYASGKYFTVTGEGAGLGDPVCLADYVEKTLMPLVGIDARQSAHDANGDPRRVYVDPATIRDLRSALNALRADDRHLWVQIGQNLRKLGDVGRELWLTWSQSSDKYDALDASSKWESFSGTESGYEAVFSKAQQAGWVNPAAKISQPGYEHIQREAYRLLTFDEFSSGPPALEIVENVLPAEGTACIYGRSGTGKTFLTIDLMLAIARGLNDWFGYRVMQSPVVYLALEGAQGMRDRLEAYRMHAACSIPDSFRILNDRFSLASADDRAELIKAVRECGLVRPVVVIDTMTRATPGLDLNGPKDMGAVIAAVDDIQREIGGLVISIYHATQKGSGGAEVTELGHSSYRGSLDASIVVYDTADSMQIKAWSTVKLKESACGMDHKFSLEAVQVRHNQWGNPKTSCAVLPMVNPPFALQPINEEMERRALADQLENYIVSGFHDGKRYTKRNLRDNPPPNMSKGDVDKAFAILEPVGRVCDAPLPKNEWQGRKKSYIHPIKRIPIEPENKNPSGSIEETDQKMEAA